jgi:hypothetical protein
MAEIKATDTSLMSFNFNKKKEKPVFVEHDSSYKPGQTLTL